MSYIRAACCFLAFALVQTAAGVCGKPLDRPPPHTSRIWWLPPVLRSEGVADRWGRRAGKGGPTVLALLRVPRLTGLEESAWGEDDEAADHNYYNSIPGKEPPLGGLVDSRLAVTQPCALATLGGLGQVSRHYPVGPEWSWTCPWCGRGEECWVWRGPGTY